MAFRFAATRSILSRAVQCPLTAPPTTATSPFLTRAAAITAPRHQHPFSTTPAAQTKTVKPHRLPSDLIPPYPYGERRIYKQSNRGLYGSARIRYGNIVAGRGNKTRRTWRPNVHVKTFSLPSLGGGGGARIKTRLTLRVLKTIRREGGLEAYLLKGKPARLRELGPGGWNVRWLLMQSAPVQRRLNEQRAALGLPAAPLRDNDELIRFALDHATPGSLGARSRETLEELRAAFRDGDGGGALVLGPRELADVQGVQELTDEEEATLLRQLDEADAAEAAAQAETQTEQKQPQL